MFATKSHPAQLKVFALDEALGEGASLKALALEKYAARSYARSVALWGVALLP